MADLIIRPDGPPSAGRRARTTARRAGHRHAPRGLARRAAHHDPVAAAAAEHPAIRIEVDGRVVEGLEGQTILEVCRDNGIEIPTLCYEPKLPGFGACRMCVVEVEGEEHPPISLLARGRAGHGRPDPDRGDAPAAPDQPRADLLRPQRVLPAAVPEQVPEPHRHPGLPQGERRGELDESRPGSSSARSRSPSCSAACAPPRARSTAGATRWTRRSRSATATATPATRSSGRCSTRASTRRCRSSARRRPGGRVAVIGSGPAGMAAAYYLLLNGHDVTVFERDPAPGGMLRYGIPQYRLPKVEVLEAEYESVTRLGGEDRVQPGPRARLHARRPPEPAASTRSSSRSAATTRTSWASPARTPTASSTASSTCARRRSACRTRATRARGSSSSAAASRRWTARGRRSARARSEVTLVYRRDMKDMPAANEVHEAIEEGVTGHLPGRPDARHHRREDRQGHRASSSSGCSSASPTRPAGAARSPRPAPSSRSPATGCCWPSARAPSSTGSGPGRDGVEATKQRRLKADAVTFETGAAGRVRHRRRPGRRRDRRPGDRRGPPGRLRRRRLPQGQRPRRRSAPARRSPSRSPSSSRSSRSRARSRSRATASRRSRPRPATATTSSTRSRTRAARRWPSRPAASSARARRSGSATCAGWASSTGRRSRRSSPRSTRAPATARVTENRFTGINHDYVRDDSHAFILREPSRCIDCGRCANVCAEVVGRRLLRLHAHRLRHAGDDAARHEPQRHALRVLRPVRRDVPHRRADAQAARAPEVRGRREPLHPVRHLRRRVPLRRGPRQRPVRAQPHLPRGADDRPARAGRRSSARPR